MFYDWLSLEELNSLNLSLIDDDEETLDYYLQRTKVTNQIRAKDFVNSVLFTPITISNLKAIFRLVSLRSWQLYRLNNTDIYYNVFNKTMSILENSKELEEAFEKLTYLSSYESLFGAKKCVHFYHLLTEYYNNRLYKDEISLHLADFLAKSKEEYVKKMTEELLRVYKPFFKLKSNNLKLNDKVRQKKQKEALKLLYLNGSLDDKIKDIRENYVSSYKDLLGQEGSLNVLLDRLIAMFIQTDTLQIENVVTLPVRYYEYLKYDKTCKIINRLNSGYVAFSDKEVDKYRNLIGYDGYQYYYSATLFSEEEVREITKFMNLDYLLKKVRRDIMEIAKKIPVSITYADIVEMEKNCEFNDLYYEFDTYLLGEISLKSLFEYLINLEDKDYDFLLSSNLIQLELINSMLKKKYRDQENFSCYVDIANRGISNLNLLDLMRNYDLLKQIMGREFNLDNIDKIFAVNDVLDKGDVIDFAILGQEVFKKIVEEKSFCVSSSKERIRVACDLVVSMYKKGYSSVPYVEKEVGNYRYSTYDVCDNDILTTGIDTGSCFRATGTQNDLFHYSILNENGFNIKITDLHGNLVARVAGFRNGNVVYLNQLRTIYDKSNEMSKLELQDVVVTLRELALDMVSKSRENALDRMKIDYVIINEAKSGMKVNIDRALVKTICTNIIDYSSKSWQEFSQNKNLIDYPESGVLESNYGNDDLVCLNTDDFAIEKVKYGDVGKIYKRPRNVVKNSFIDNESEAKINKLRAMVAYLNKTKFSYVSYLPSSKVISGDNWYIVYSDDGIIDSLCLDDEQAILEFNTYYCNLVDKKKKR